MVNVSVPYRLVFFLQLSFPCNVTVQDLHTQFVLMVSHLTVFFLYLTGIEKLSLLVELMKAELCLSSALAMLSCLETNLTLNLDLSC